MNLILNSDSFDLYWYVIFYRVDRLQSESLIKLPHE